MNIRTDIREYEYEYEYWSHTAYLALDRAKVSRGKARLMSLGREKGEQESKKSDIQGIFFDGRKEKKQSSII